MRHASRSQRRSRVTIQAMIVKAMAITAARPMIRSATST
jgi:hypothetical protein